MPNRLAKRRRLELGGAFVFREVVMHGPIGLIGFIIVVICLGASVEAQSAAGTARGSVFYPAALVHRARRGPLAARAGAQAAERARRWLEMSDSQLWDLMFGNTIKRAWQVWSDGYCPACRKGVPMYDWKMDPLNEPWKTACPHCGERFPKNDFGAFYRSGLDEHGIFDPKRADRKLLFNADHPDANDPLHLYGVDDGEGYEADGHRWRFIGGYLIYGQWKQAIVEGIRRLALAYTLTGDARYAHKAGVLLDRVADIYPSMNFGEQGVMYEGPPAAGYVSTWHDACEETREMALAFDQVRDAIARDSGLASFLSGQARRFGIPAPKEDGAAVVRNIETGLLRHPIEHRERIYSNYPRTEFALAVLMTVLDWPNNRQAVRAHIDRLLEQGTAVDGVTGEKGLAGYSSFTIQGLADFLGVYARIEPGFLRDCFQRHPALRNTWRFFIDTWINGEYYPQIGDTGGYMVRNTTFAGLVFTSDATAESALFSTSLAPSSYTFLWDLYKVTRDPAYVQVLHRANGNSVKGLPHDLLVESPERFQRDVQRVIDRAGPALPATSVDKHEWHLAILRAGKKDPGRALVLDYDSGGYHAHADGLNVGLFAYGLDLLPDFGYPPVQFGGWGAPRARWYNKTAAHNTVVIDGKDHRSLAGQGKERAGYEGLPAGKTTLFANGDGFHGVRASGPELVGEKQFERTVGMVDVSSHAFYVIDIFRVVGGHDHARFLHGPYGDLSSPGLNLKPAADYGYDTQLRNFREDAAPPAGWWAEWQIRDRYGYLPADSDIRLRYHDLTGHAAASLCEAWVGPTSNRDPDGTWINSLMIRRRSDAAPLASTFVSVLEPYAHTRVLRSVRRLPVKTPNGSIFGESTVAVEIELADGGHDLVLAADTENPQALRPGWPADQVMEQRDWKARLNGELAVVRRAPGGETVRVTLCRCQELLLPDVEVVVRPEAPCVEIAFENGQALLRNGRPSDIVRLRWNGRALRPTVTRHERGGHR